MVRWFIISPSGTPTAPKRRRTGKRGRTGNKASTSNVTSVFREQQLHVANKFSAVEVIESPEALPCSSASIEIQNLSPPRLSRYRSNRKFVPPSSGTDAYVLGTPPSPAKLITRRAEVLKRAARSVDEDVDEVVEDSTEMERLFYPLNKGS
jgi:hypothetical protein